MNILVCVKQVPDTTEIKIDPVKNTLIRAGVPSILNPFDEYALEMALKLKDTEGAHITVITMGPEQAKEVLKKSIAVGADKAYIVSDRAFGGSDTLATSYILSCVIKKLQETQKFDLIFCGLQAIDGDTAQVGPEIAEHLDIPQGSYVTEIVESSDTEVIVKRETGDGYEILAIEKPALLTVTKTKDDLRFPTIRNKLAANKADIPAITSQDIDIDLSQAGLKGSPTKVKKTFTPSVTKTSKVIDGSDPEQAAKEVAEILLGINS